MSTLVAIALLFAGLTIAAWVTKRRFGVLGLALAAGALLSETWAATLTPFLERQGVEVVAPPLSALVQIVLTLAPSIILLFSGPTYTKGGLRLAGSIAYGLFGLTLVANVLSAILVLAEPGSLVLQFIHNNRVTIIVAALAFALTDLVMTKRPKMPSSKKHGSH